MACFNVLLGESSIKKFRTVSRNLSTHPHSLRYFGEMAEFVNDFMVVSRKAYLLPFTFKDNIVDYRGFFVRKTDYGSVEEDFLFQHQTSFSSMDLFVKNSRDLGESMLSLSWRRLSGHQSVNIILILRD